MFGLVTVDDARIVISISTRQPEDYGIFQLRDQFRIIWSAATSRPTPDRYFPQHSAETRYRSQVFAALVSLGRGDVRRRPTRRLNPVANRYHIGKARFSLALARHDLSLDFPLLLLNEKQVVITQHSLE